MRSTTVGNRVVEIQWIDSASPMAFETYFREEVKKLKPLPMNDVGYEVYRDKDRVVIAGEVSGIGGHRRLIVIPTSGIIRRRVLR